MTDKFKEWTENGASKSCATYRFYGERGTTVAYVIDETLEVTILAVGKLADTEPALSALGDAFPTANGLSRI